MRMEAEESLNMAKSLATVSGAAVVDPDLERKLTEMFS